MQYAYIFSGLPGVGKTTLAKLLAENVKNSSYYRVDTIEYYFKKNYPSIELGKQGYEIVYYQARESIELGNNVIIDSCNPVNESRELWGKLSNSRAIKIINIEVVCSNYKIHQDQVEARFNSNKKRYPSWNDVLDKNYEKLSKEVIIVDTANNDEKKIN